MAARHTRSVLALCGWMLASLATGAIGAIASVNAGSFYKQLNVPSWAPPGWLFSPVWTTLYLLMGIAAWQVWQARGPSARSALLLYLFQLAVNALWSWLFFAWHRGAAAFADILLLWLLIAATIVAFWRIRRTAGMLLVPYLAWVSFAMALNYSVWQRNPALLG